MIYDRLYAPKAELSGMALVLHDIAKTDDPAVIAKLLRDDPGLYDRLMEVERR